MQVIKQLADAHATPTSHTTGKPTPIITQSRKELIASICEKMDQYRGHEGLGYLGNTRRLNRLDLKAIENQMDAAIRAKNAGEIEIGAALFHGWSWFPGYYEALYGPCRGAQIAADLGILVDEEI